MRAAREQKTQEAELRRREQELAEREIDIVERELNLIMAQMGQEQPRAKKRRAHFRCARLKLREGNRISLPSGAEPRPAPPQPFPPPRTAWWDQGEEAAGLRPPRAHRPPPALL